MTSLNGRAAMLHRMLALLGIRRSVPGLRSQLLALHILRTTYP